jgi:6-pyruvoyltetrahydropterin/6-carboxytetrahydropterin synthase
MFTITKTMYTETGHRLMDYKGKCAHLHGHSYQWEVTIESKELLNNGMVMDFKDLKRIMQDTIGKLDHAMVLHEDDPVLVSLKDITATDGSSHRVIATPWNPTAENFAKFYYEEIDKILCDCFPGVRMLEIIVGETETSYATYRGEENERIVHSSRQQAAIA